MFRVSKVGASPGCGRKSSSPGPVQQWLQGSAGPGHQCRVSRSQWVSRAQGKLQHRELGTGSWAMGSSSQGKQPCVEVFNGAAARSGAALITMGTRSSKQAEIIPGSITAAFTSAPE